MFGLSLEKLVVLAIIAAFVLGPHRLPHYAQRLGELVRAFRDVLDSARERTRTELGPDLTPEDWRRLDPRRYDPRSIVREALADEDASPRIADAVTSADVPAPPQAPERRRPRYDSAGRIIRTSP